jgi:hypothetical protein
MGEAREKSGPETVRTLTGADPWISASKIRCRHGQIVKACSDARRGFLGAMRMAAFTVLGARAFATGAEFAAVAFFVLRDSLTLFDFAITFGMRAWFGHDDDLLSRC